MTTTSEISNEQLIEKCYAIFIEGNFSSEEFELFSKLLTRYKSLTADRSEEVSALKQYCDANHLSIDELIYQFSFQGFDTENWDGEEGAEKAIVDGVVNSISVDREQLVEQCVEAIRNIEPDENGLFFSHHEITRLRTALTKLLEK